MRVRLVKDFYFEAAHSLPHVMPDHKCARLHGHSYKVTISVEGPIDPVSGWFMDHAEISQLVKPLIEQLDHRYLNEINGLENPTFEMIAKWFWDRLQPSLEGLAEIEIAETPTSRCIYRGE